MPINRIEPESVPDFRSNPGKFFRVFDSNADKLKLLLEKKPEIDEVVSVFEDKKSPLYDSFSKAMRVLELAYQERRFTLSPVVAKYNNISHETHQLQALLFNNLKISHVFIKPVHVVEDLCYTYNLYIPIPADILEIDDKKKLLKEHWNMIIEHIPVKLRHELLTDFLPLHTIHRVYGWDGAWLAYEVTVIDRGDFWSPPLYKSPYNGVQPFIGLPKGEFAILEHDETDSSHRKVYRAISAIKERVKENKNIIFEESKSIEVNPQWVVASVNYSSATKNPDLRKVSQNFGGKLGTASIDERLPNSAKDLLDFMKRESFGKPQYEFTEDDIGNCRIHKKFRI